MNKYKYIILVFLLLAGAGAGAQITDCNYAFFKVLSPETVIREMRRPIDDRELLASAAKNVTTCRHGVVAQKWGSVEQVHSETDAIFTVLSHTDVVYAVTVPRVWALTAPAGGHDAIVRLYLSIPAIASAMNAPGIQAFALQAAMKMSGQWPKLHLHSIVPVVVNYN